MYKLFLVLLITVFIKAQNNITFEQLSSDTVLNQFVTDGYKFTSNKMATNYGCNLDFNGTSLFMYQNDIVVSKVNNNQFNMVSLWIYQVSEAQNNELIIEGWLNNLLKTTKTFNNIQYWQILTLNIFNVDKIVIKSAITSCDYNLDNFLLMDSPNIPTSVGIRKK